MWYAMIQLFFVGIALCVRLADTLGNDLAVALLVTSILTILALHTSRVF